MLVQSEKGFPTSGIHIKTRSTALSIIWGHCNATLASSPEIWLSTIHHRGNWTMASTCDANSWNTPQIKFPDMTKHQIRKKNNPNSERCERISAFFSPVQRQTFISILKVIVLVLFQCGEESITPLKEEAYRIGSRSEPISMECTRIITHMSSHAPHALPVCSDPSCLQLFPSISLSCFFFVSSLSPMPSVFPEVPPTLCIARIGGKGRDGCVCQQTMLPGSEDHVHWCSEENKSATTVHGCSSSITEVGLKGKRCILCYSSSLHRLQDLWLKSDLKQIPLIPLHADFKTHFLKRNS